MKKKSQKQAILEYIEAHDSITPIEALNKFGCFRLAAIIFLLREEGYVIKTDINEDKKYAVYTLMKEGVEYDG